MVGDALRDKKLNRPEVFASLAVLSGDIVTNLKSYGAISHVPAAATPNLRNDMYLAGDAIRLLPRIRRHVQRRRKPRRSKASAAVWRQAPASSRFG